MFVVCEHFIDAAVFQAQIGVVGEDGPERHLEDGVYGAVAGIDCGNAGGGKYDVTLVYVVADVSQEGRFSRTGFSGEKYRLPGVFQECIGVLKLAVVGIYGECGVIVHTQGFVGYWVGGYAKMALPIRNYAFSGKTGGSCLGNLRAMMFPAWRVG